jgi:hypothetical protein
MFTNEKVRPALQCQTDCEKKSFNTSIPQPTMPKHLAIEMEPTKKRDPIGLDSFIGNIRSFRLYVKAQ